MYYETTDNAKTLETTIGRLNHAAHTISQARYFINYIQQLLERCKKHVSQTLNKNERQDLHIWIHILHHFSQNGININNITFTKPTKTTISDAYEHGMGGYSLEGLAWRYDLPQ